MKERKGKKKKKKMAVLRWEKALLHKEQTRLQEGAPGVKPRFTHMSGFSRGLRLFAVSHSGSKMSPQVLGPGAIPYTAQWEVSPLH